MAGVEVLMEIGFLEEAGILLFSLDSGADKTAVALDRIAGSGVWLSLGVHQLRLGNLMIFLILQQRNLYQLLI